MPSAGMGSEFSMSQAGSDRRNDLSVIVESAHGEQLFGSRERWSGAKTYHAVSALSAAAAASSEYFLPVIT